jgi:adenosine deaminase
LTRRMADARIPLTVCPSSNVLIANHVDRLALHPYPRMRDAGLLATVNTDDPALTDLTLAGEYRAVADAFDYDLDDMVAIALDGIDATWLDDDERRKLRSRVRDTLRRHRHAT